MGASPQGREAPPPASEAGGAGRAGQRDSSVHPWLEERAAGERVLDVYRRPYDTNFPVVCMDETPRQLSGETRTPVPQAPDQGDRAQDQDRLARFLRDIAAQYPDAARITLVMDNLNTHRPGAPGRRPETESKPRSTGSSPPPPPRVSGSSVSIRRVMCDMTLDAPRTSG